jgi:hypothetical protein
MLRKLLLSLCLTIFLGGCQVGNIKPYTIKDYPLAEGYGVVVTRSSGGTVIWAHRASLEQTESHHRFASGNCQMLGGTRGEYCLYLAPAGEYYLEEFTTTGTITRVNPLYYLDKIVDGKTSESSVRTETVNYSSGNGLDRSSFPYRPRLGSFFIRAGDVVYIGDFLVELVGGHNGQIRLKGGSEISRKEDYEPKISRVDTYPGVIRFIQQKYPELSPRLQRVLAEFY